MTVLGSPIGTEELIQSFTDRRLEEERRLWNATLSVLVLQCAWQLLLQCAGPRCHHVLWTVPSSQSARSRTRRRDVPDHAGAVGRPSRLPRTDCDSTGHHHLTVRLGGLGLRSAARTGRGAYWGADAVPMLHDRLLTATEEILAQLRGEPEDASVSRRPWGMATWLAVLRVFHFQTPLSGDRSAHQIMRRRPDSLAVPLWPRGRSSFLQFTHRARVPSATHAFPDTRVGEVTPSIAPDRGQMRVRRPERHFRKTSGRLSTVWPVEKACRAHGENVGPSVPKSWRQSLATSNCGT